MSQSYRGKEVPLTLPLLSSRRVLNNYLVWQTVRRLTKFLSKPFREAFKEFQKAIPSFTERREEQWRYCVDGVNDAMGFVVGAMFVREVFQNETRSTVSSHSRSDLTKKLYRQYSEKLLLSVNFCKYEKK